MSQKEVDPALILELQPEWEEVSMTVLKGKVEVYINTIVDGATDQATVMLDAKFERFGDTQNECKGVLTLGLDGLVGKTPMLYGPTGDSLYGAFVSGGWDTHACDTIFQDVGQLTWGEVFEQVQAEPVTTEEPPPPDSTPPPVSGRTPPPLPGE